MQFSVDTGIDIVEGTRLVQAMGWEADPARFERPRELDPEGCFTARGSKGEALGVVTCVVWPGDPSLAWIGSMVVDEVARGHGVGRALLRRALAYADERGARIAGLDSTQAGRPLYEREGFVAWAESAVWERPVGAPRPAPSASGEYAIYPVSSAEIMELMEYDRPRFGASRARLLSALISERPHHSFVAVHRRTGAFSGLALGLPERIGPLVAEAPEAAAWLLHACERTGTPPKAIVAGWNVEAERVFADAGYQKRNGCLRMFRDKTAAHRRANSEAAASSSAPGLPQRVYCPAAWSLG